MRPISSILNNISISSQFLSGTSTQPQHASFNFSSYPTSKLFYGEIGGAAKDGGFVKICAFLVPTVYRRPSAK